MEVVNTMIRKEWNRFYLDNPRPIQVVLAEGPLEEIHKLQAAIDQYVSRLEEASVT